MRIAVLGARGAVGSALAGEAVSRGHDVTDELVVAADGDSSVSIADLAVALLDEIERPRHRRRRFTVAY